MKVKIFWQEQCPNCPTAKELGKELEKKNIDVELKNIKGADGLADAVFYNVMATPSVVICDESGESVKEWLAEIPKIEEVMEAVK